VVVTVGVRELRNNLRAYLDRVRAGEEVVVTERGKPVARITPAAWEQTLERLIAEGTVTPASRPRTPIRPDEIVEVRGSVTDLLLEDRRAGY
jgi:prevent-host-death family protein